MKVLEHGGATAGYGSVIRFAPDQKVAVIVLANRSRAVMPKTVEAACELVLPFGPKPEPKKPSADPVTAEEGEKLAGLYKSNFRAVTVTRTDDGKLAIKGGAGALFPSGTYERVDGWRFNKGPDEVVFVPGPDGRAGYLSYGGRALARAEKP